MTIILDAMGSDTHPDPEIQASVQVARETDIEIILVGREEILAPKLKEAGGADLSIQIIHAPDVLEMTDKPVQSSRKKPNNSMAVGLELVKSGQGDAFVTMGNSGAAMFMASKILRVRGRPSCNGRAAAFENWPLYSD